MICVFHYGLSKVLTFACDSVCVCVASRILCVRACACVRVRVCVFMLPTTLQFCGVAFDELLFAACLPNKVCSNKVFSVMIW